MQKTDSAPPSRLMVGGELPARMTAADMMREFGIKTATFYRYLAERKFDRFEILPRIGARAWSGALVKAYFDGQRAAAAGRRYFGKR